MTTSQVTGEYSSAAPFARVVGTQTQISFTSSCSKACQTLSACRRPPLPGPVEAIDTIHLREKRRKQKARLSKIAFFSNWTGTPLSTVKFAAIEQILVRINPFAHGCCFYHASLRVLSNAVQELVLCECDSEVRPHDGWQCRNCQGLNEGAL